MKRSRSLEVVASSRTVDPNRYKAVAPSAFTASVCCLRAVIASCFRMTLYYRHRMIAAILARSAVDFAAEVPADSIGPPHAAAATAVHQHQPLAQVQQERVDRYPRRDGAEARGLQRGRFGRVDLGQPVEARVEHAVVQRGDQHLADTAVMHAGRLPGRSEGCCHVRSPVSAYRLTASDRAACPSVRRPPPRATAAAATRRSGPPPPSTRGTRRAPAPPRCRAG